MKILFLLIGLAIGFGGGVWWGVRNPAKAQQLAAEEERRVLEAKIALTEAMKEKLDRILARQKDQQKSGAPAGAGFVSGKAGTGGVDPELAAFRDEQQKELAEMKRQLDALPRK